MENRVQFRNIQLHSAPFVLYHVCLPVSEVLIFFFFVKAEILGIEQKILESHHL